jgi:ATP-binding cassette, subfamily C, type I secretion system permease/ATPase
MGMAGSLAQRWSGVNNRYVAANARLSDVAGSFGSVSKVLRLLLQSMMLGLGAYLVIRQELTAGAMIAASIMMGRALAPIETAIANWRAFVAARQSVGRLSEALARTALKHNATNLPGPKRSLDVEHVTVVAPGGTTPIVAGVRFGLKAGEALGIIGPRGPKSCCPPLASSRMRSHTVGEHRSGPPATGRGTRCSLTADGASNGTWVLP